MNAIIGLLSSSKLNNLLLKKQEIMHGKIVGLATLVIRIAEEAIKTYCEERVLDPLIGNNACQIPAAMLCDMRKKKVIEITQFSNKISALKNLEIKITQFPFETSKNIAEYLKKVTSQESFSKEETFIVLCFLLTKTRDLENSMRTNESQLLSYIPEHQKQVSKEDVVEVVYEAKRQIAQYCTQFLEKLLKENDVPSYLKRLLNKREQFDAVGCSIMTTSCFFNLELLLHFLTKNQTYLALSISCNEVATTLLLQSEEGRFVAKERTLANAKEPVFLVRLESRSSLDEFYALRQKLKTKGDLIKNFPHSRIKKLILMNAALHPQYAGIASKKEIPLFVCEEFKECLSKLSSSEQSEESISEKIKQKYFPKEVNMLNNLCRPSTISSVAVGYRQFEKMKQKAEKLADSQKNLPLSVQHIFYVLVQDLKFEEGGKNEAT